MNPARHWKWIALVFALSAATYGWLDFHNRHGETALLARANEYWLARTANDLLTAYEMEAETASGLLRPDEVETRPEWGLRLVSFKLGPVEFYKDHAEIEITTAYTIRELTKPMGESTRKDLWTFMKGRWYHGAPEKGGAGIRKPESAQRLQPAPTTEPAPPK